MIIAACDICKERMPDAPLCHNNRGIQSNKVPLDYYFTHKCDECCVAIDKMDVQKLLRMAVLELRHPAETKIPLVTAAKKYVEPKLKHG